MKNLLTFIKKILNKTIVAFITVSLIIIVTWASAYSITMNKNYYRHQFEKNDTASTLHWVYQDKDSGDRIYKSYDADDLEKIMNQIVDYLANKEESMQVIDDEGMNVFSNQALKHMADVKKAYNHFMVLAIVLIVLIIPMFIYLHFNFKDIKSSIKKQLIWTFSIIFGLLLILAVMMLIDDDWTFTQFHHILFPNKQSFEDAFFSRESHYEEEYYINNLLLVQILTLDIFIDAAWIIIASIVVCTGIYLFVLLTTLSKRNKKDLELNTEN